MTENEIAERVIGCAIKVHRELGPGLLESSYKTSLQFELNDQGLVVETEKPLPLIYRKVKLDCGYRLDLVVENKVILEIKAVEALNNIHTAQIMTYLRLSQCKLGILLNFNVMLLKNGIKRIANNL
jgi:GxxExxY protein